MRKLTVSDDAEEDLLEIWDYIAPRDLAAAEGVISEISAVFSMLAENPLAGRSRIEFRQELRSFPVGMYLVFYRVIEDGIVIVRVLHGARDLPGVL